MASSETISTQTLGSELANTQNHESQYLNSPIVPINFANKENQQVYACSPSDFEPLVHQPRCRGRKVSKPSSDKSKQRTSESTARRDIVQEFAEKCNLHGVYEIYHATALRRMFWLSAFCIALGVAVYECVVIVDNYRQSPVVVSYIVKEAREGLDIPDVFVCPFNRFDKKFVETNNISEELLQYIEFSFDDILKYQRLYDLQLNVSYEDISYSNELNNQLNQMLATLNLTYTEFISAASVSCLDIIPYCLDNVDRYNCCETAEESWFTVGKCFRIKGITQYGNGYGWGLSIVARNPIDRYSPSLTNFHNDGFAIKLAESSRGLDYDLTFLPTGSHALMPLRATNFNFMNDPPRFTCVDKHAQSYSRQTCFDVCMSKEGEKACKCARPGTLQPELPLCTTNQTFTCVMDTVRRIMSTTEDYFAYIYDCREQCKPNCSYWQYTMSVSYANFPAPTLKKYVIPEDWAQYQNTTILDIYYENLEYTVIQHHHSMTVDTFIANIGGQVGLWIGGSILTTLQVLVFLVQLIYGRQPADADKSTSNLASRLSKRIKRKEFLKTIQHETKSSFLTRAVASNPPGNMPHSAVFHSVHCDGCNQHFLVPSTFCLQFDGAQKQFVPRTTTEPQLAQTQRLPEGSNGRSATSLPHSASKHHSCVSNDCDLILIGQSNANGDSNNNQCKTISEDLGAGNHPDQCDQPDKFPNGPDDQNILSNPSIKDSISRISNHSCNGSLPIDTTINSYKSSNDFSQESLI